jgi:hypothetical protein
MSLTHMISLVDKAQPFKLRIDNLLVGESFNFKWNDIEGYEFVHVTEGNYEVRKGSSESTVVAIAASAATLRDYDIFGNYTENILFFTRCELV